MGLTLALRPRQPHGATRQLMAHDVADATAGALLRPRAVLKGEIKRCSKTAVVQKNQMQLICSTMFGGNWRLAVGRWWQVAAGGWRLVAVDGSQWLVGVGGMWLAVDGSWQRLAVGGWWQLAAVGGWQLVVGGGCWLVVGG